MSRDLQLGMKNDTTTDAISHFYSLSVLLFMQGRTLRTLPLALGFKCELPDVHQILPSTDTASQLTRLGFLDLGVGHKSCCLSAISQSGPQRCAIRTAQLIRDLMTSTRERPPGHFLCVTSVKLKMNKPLTQRN